jgi:hypothetical protein
MSRADIMQLLANGIPITLLCDVVSTAAPDSLAINSVERPTTDSIWLETAVSIRERWNAASA